MGAAATRDDRLKEAGGSLERGDGPKSEEIPWPQPPTAGGRSHGAPHHPGSTHPPSPTPATRTHAQSLLGEHAHEECKVTGMEHLTGHDTSSTSSDSPVSRAYWKLDQIITEHLEAPGSFGAGWWDVCCVDGSAALDLGEFGRRLALVGGALNPSPSPKRRFAWRLDSGTLPPPSVYPAPSF